MSNYQISQAASLWGEEMQIEKSHNRHFYEVCFPELASTTCLTSCQGHYRVHGKLANIQAICQNPPSTRFLAQVWSELYRKSLFRDSLHLRPSKDAKQINNVSIARPRCSRQYFLWQRMKLTVRCRKDGWPWRDCTIPTCFKRPSCRIWDLIWTIGSEGSSVSEVTEKNDLIKNHSSTVERLNWSVEFCDLACKAILGLQWWRHS